MLGACGCEGLVSWLCREANIKDFVRVTWSTSARARGQVEEVNVVLVAPVNQGHQSAISRESDAVYASSALCELEFMLLLSCLRVPDKD